MQTMSAIRSHSLLLYSESPSCVKCGSNHNTVNCVKSSELPAKCALCSGAHTANYKGCPSLTKFLNTYHKNGHLKTTPPVPPLVHSKLVLPVTVVPPSAHTRYKEKNPGPRHTQKQLQAPQTINLFQKFYLSLLRN
ncbi:unnamed protein product [Macrosiphum euphorbiae]|uniref:Uncharacterized protein n=2 Tax=Macrosiphum euphorbiae TaxID=13131 RepID=A0AAV0XN35_9HEMI|nr:unnamed protein product [Macrosiphum euphorbiae]